MDPLEYIQSLQEIDPTKFNHGFEDFCLQLREMCIRFSRNHETETPYTAGFKFASSIAFDQINFVVQNSIKAAEEQEKIQQQIKLNLEKMYNM
jgi:hypothetical protein